MSTIKILIAEPKDFSEAAIAALKEIGEVTVKETNEIAFFKAFYDYDIIWFRLGFKITASSLKKDCRCKYLCCPVTGLDHIDLEACKVLKINILSLKGEVEFLKEIRATAELTIGLTLSLMRHIVSAATSVKDWNWNRDLFKGHEIFGKTVGVLGLGRLGSITTGYFKALGAHVIGYDIKEIENSPCDLTDNMESLLEQSDILSIHINYNRSNHHLLSYKEFQAMKPESILINTSRGAVIDTEALVHALENRFISGAALDVIENEFDIIENPLIKYARNYQNLLITPHIGGNTSESFSKTELFLVGKLKKTLLTDYVG